MATRTKAKPKAKPAAKSAAAPRQTEAQLDKQAAQVVKMRDNQGKAWGDIADALDIAPSRLRQLYNRGGGSPTATKAAAPAKRGAAKAKPKPAAAAKGGAKGKTSARGKRNPS